MAAFVKWLSRYLPNAPREPEWSRYRPLIEAVRARRAALRPLSDGEIRTLAGRDKSVVECFALASEALRRRLGLDPFDVQVTGALAMHDGCIAEMQTGEGKTLTAVMTVFANALAGFGAHVWTANDY